MIDYQKILVDFLRKEQRRFLGIEKLQGSSDSVVYKVTVPNGIEIYRVGPQTDINASIQIYSRFKQLLTQYSEIFPEIRIVSQGEISIAQVEYVGTYSLEEQLKQLDGNQAGMNEIIRINQEVLKNIRTLYTETASIGNFQENKLFFKELFEALELNLNKAGLKKSGNAFLTKKQRELSGEVEKCISSLAHKDLSVGNILISDTDRSVKFIDPRVAIPHVITSNARGSIAVDIIGYYISIIRKEMELQRKNPQISLQAIKKKIEDEIQKQIAAKIYTPILQETLMAFWYSVYAACKCSYCTAPERLWLYDTMVNRLQSFLN